MGQEETQVQPGDIVLVLLAFATGNTDFHEGGPFGDIPGGLLIASMISDLLSGQFIERWEVDIAFILIFGVDRTIYVSNFPLEKLHASYADFFGVYRTVLSEFTEAEQRAMLHDNAVKFYRF